MRRRGTRVHGLVLLGLVARSLVVPGWERTTDSADEVNVV